MLNKILSICMILVMVPLLQAEEPNFKIFDKSVQSVPMIFSKKMVVKESPQTKIIEIKQLNEIEYSDLIKIVRQGKAVTVAVGDTSLKADYFVKRIPNTEIGIWRCFLDNGEPKMERVRNEIPYQRNYLERVVPFSGST